MTLPLFREQALQRATDRSYGDILLTRPPSFALLTGLFTALAIAIVLFFAFFSYTRKAQVSGVILPSAGMIRVVAPQRGLIAERRVVDGQPVKAGDVLFVLSSERTTETQGNAEQAVSELLQSRRDSLQVDAAHQLRQSAQRKQATQRRARDLVDEVRRVDEQRALQVRRVALADEAVRRYTDLQAAHFISAAQLQDRLAELLDQRQRLGDLERAAASAARELASTQAELRDLVVQGERDQQATRRSIAVIEQDLIESEARRRIWVRAPHDGIVAAVAAEPGHAVAPNQALAIVLPQNGQLEAELYAPSRAAGFIQAGMTVMLRYQAFSHQKFGQHAGRVREVSRTAMRPEEIPFPGIVASTGSASEPLYRIRVSLGRQDVQAYGLAQPLRPGMALEASVLLDHRRLYEWILEPLYSITGRA
ncbi:MULTISPECIES: HlyD family secretion protein [unclassified Rhizobacter]|uniref:HlyD family secretion protein n=1 Tax=unclassified Rhizobacter TaxID=2640088 RepID=UPI0006F3AE27|nr:MULTISPECIES: HlyD family efflux transporter periplasmic adaptor subunit [unclassified Rhizobacter]KQU78373.1 secretion protein [Rhizobacter sp. Root29]KQW10893.1 secretion protein [Rhizobacter sp. Root1238]KRB25239.1 secretion protein [Rhizobacter sp. Root16D2]